jgi:transcriptional regulator with AAA-type ATPase domain
LETLLLYCDGQLLREFPLGTSPLEIGRAPGCDIVLHDADIADRQLLVQRQRGTVVAYDLQVRDRGQIFLPLDRPFPLSRRYQLIRKDRRPATLGLHEQGTDALVVTRASLPRLMLLIGRGKNARRIAITERPVHIGTDPGNDVVLYDKAVSRFHCRIDSTPHSLRVRDLHSRNGTFINGVRVLQAEITHGSQLHLGHTHLCLVSQNAHDSAGLVAQSSAMQRAIADMQRFAGLSWPVLICGPSGVGKEAIARALHEQGSRARRPWIAVNAGGLPRDLLESELFGHERGAFTGAHALHKGAFERAHGGTLFLDEIGELPLHAQSRLLRVVETWEVQRVGGETMIPIDVRLVCATHRDLRALVSEGHFREDLYYRLARLVIQIPALKDRLCDLEPLSQFFLASMRDEIGPRVLSTQALDQMSTHTWPGNARELRNVLAMAAASTGNHVLDGPAIADALDCLHGSHRAKGSPAAVEDVVARHRGNLSAAARSLGIPRSTLRDRLSCAKKKS